jgi:L-iditol 2-dehydrogenase
VVEVGSEAKGWTLGTRVMGGGYAGYAKYAVVPPPESPVQMLLTIPDNVASEDASMLEPLADCIHSLRDQAQLKVGQTVLLLGSGPMGLMHVMVAKSMGATVLVSEPDKARRTWATKFGADVTIDPSTEDLVARVKEITAGKGADSVVIVIGIPALIPQALAAVKTAGRVVIFAGIPVGSQPAAVDFNVIHYQEIVLTGCEWIGVGPNRDLATFQVALDMIANGRAPVGQLITHRFSLEDVHEAFRVASSREGLKVIVYPWGVSK